MKAPLLLLPLVLAACVGVTTSGRPGMGQVQMVSWRGADYPLRVTRDFEAGGFWTRIVAPDARTAQGIYSEICERRAFSAADWPDGRLARDGATGEWAVRGECLVVPG